MPRSEEMKRYKANPKKPYRLTEAEKRHLDAAPIDYSDIPELDDAFFENASRFEMKRIYRPFPTDGTDIWIVVILIIGLLLYVAWRWV